MVLLKAAVLLGVTLHVGTELTAVQAPARAESLGGKWSAWAQCEAFAKPEPEDEDDEDEDDEDEEEGGGAPATDTLEPELDAAAAGELASSAGRRSALLATSLVLALSPALVLALSASSSP